MRKSTIEYETKRVKSIHKREKCTRASKENCRRPKKNHMQQSKDIRENSRN